MSHISKLVIKNLNTNANIVLKFKEGTNIIVGPKGGGKSTLLVLLYMAYKQSSTMENRKLAKDTWQILNNFGLEFLELHYSNGTVVDKESLSTALAKNVEFVTQSDEIKTKINEAEEIELDKQNFIKNLITAQAQPIIQILDNYYNSFNEIYNIRARKIDWKKLKEYEKKPTNYYVSLKQIILDKVNFKTNIEIEKVLKSISLLELYKELNIDDIRINPYFNVIDEILKIHYQDLDHFIRVVALQKAKVSMINFLDQEIKKDASSETKIKHFEQESTLFFKDMAKAIAKNAAAFFNIVSTSTEIYLNDKQPSQYGLTIAIDDTIEIEKNESHIFDILSVTLYKASKDYTDWRNWIKSSIKSERAIKSDKISTSDAVINMLKSKTEEKVKLIADDIDYNKMSLGQKTSFGLKYKIQTNNNKFLFLDQPEDNIDSYTIFSNLIPLIIDKQESIDQQSFIVTHNPNFGILSKPKSITSCDLTDKVEPYRQIFDPTAEMTTNEIKQADSPLAHYLEGGKKALKDRYSILIKENKDE